MNVICNRASSVSGSRGTFAQAGQAFFDVCRGWSWHFDTDDRADGAFQMYIDLLINDGYYDTGIALIIQIDSYLRPSGVFDLLWRSTKPPTPGSGIPWIGSWVFFVGDSVRGKAFKTKQQKDIVIFGIFDRGFVNDIFSAYFRTVQRRTILKKP